MVLVFLGIYPETLHIDPLYKLQKPEVNLCINDQLILGRKVMTNVDSILKSRDIIMPTKVHLVKAMVFLVVMYGCESCTIKQAE